MHAETLTFQTYETCILVDISHTKEENTNQEIHLGGKKAQWKERKKTPKNIVFFI